MSVPIEIPARVGTVNIELSILVFNILCSPTARQCTAAAAASGSIQEVVTSLPAATLRAADERTVLMTS